MPTIPLSPALFVTGATTLVASVKSKPASPRPAEIELDPLRRDCHGPGDAITTAAFIAHVGYWSHRRSKGKTRWPFPLDADCNALARHAAHRGVLGIGEPEPGAIYLRWSMLEQRFTRASVLLSATDRPGRDGARWAYDCTVLEGSLLVTPVPRYRQKQSEIGVETKVEWARVAEVICCPSLGDRFMSWVDLDDRNDTTRVSPEDRAV